MMIDCLEFNKKYPDCKVFYIDQLGNGKCTNRNFYYYNTPECGYDLGDCIEFNEAYPDCKVHFPYKLGNGICDGESYNVTECDYDGGDCLMPDGYTNCNVSNPELLGNGRCEALLGKGEYNTTDCGYDLGDCLLKPVENHPECNVLRPDLIGDGSCDRDDSKYNAGEGVGTGYNTLECQYDGGDCTYPDCHPPGELWFQIKNELGNGECKPSYNIPGCFYDDGDCILDEYPDCHVYPPSFVGDGKCHGQEFNTEECGWDGGDCDAFNMKYPNCTAKFPWYIGNGYCHYHYNTIECGWDGGDCAVDGHPMCHVDDPTLLGNGDCNGGEYNTEACAYDLGDCVR